MLDQNFLLQRGVIPGDDTSRQMRRSDWRKGPRNAWRFLILGAEAFHGRHVQEYIDHLRATLPKRWSSVLVRMLQDMREGALRYGNASAINRITQRARYRETYGQNISAYVMLYVYDTGQLKVTRGDYQPPTQSYVQQEDYVVRRTTFGHLPRYLQVRLHAAWANSGVAIQDAKGLGVCFGTFCEKWYAWLYAHAPGTSAHDVWVGLTMYTRNVAAIPEVSISSKPEEPARKFRPSSHAKFLRASYTNATLSSHPSRALAGTTEYCCAYIEITPVDAARIHRRADSIRRGAVFGLRRKEKAYAAQVREKAEELLRGSPRPVDPGSVVLHEATSARVVHDF